MRWSRYLGVIGIGVCAIATSACDSFKLGCLLCPTGPPFQVSGEVLDDSLDLPPGSSVRITLDGVKVEVLDGPEVGRFAITGPSGQFDLGTITSKTRLRASKEGWLPKEWSIDDYSTRAWFHLSQAPHVVWGCFSLGVSGNALIPNVGVRVEIIEGPSTGRVALSDNAGYFRLDDLPTQGPFSLTATKAGYRTETLSARALDANQNLTGGCRVLTPQ